MLICGPLIGQKFKSLVRIHQTISDLIIQSVRIYLRSKGSPSLQHDTLITRLTLFQRPSVRGGIRNIYLCVYFPFFVYLQYLQQVCFRILSRGPLVCILVVIYVTATTAYSANSLFPAGPHKILNISSFLGKSFIEISSLSLIFNIKS